MGTANVEDVYELSPLQHGILFHSLYDADADVYLNQRSFVLEGELDVDALLDACRDTVRAHPALRTSFHWEGLDKPLQVVHREVPFAVTRLDWSGEPDQDRRLERLLADDLAAGFDPAVQPLQRLHLVRLAPARHVFVWTHHLLVLDGWSVPVFLRDVLQRYFHRTDGTPPPQAAPAYREYIAWLQRQDLAAAQQFWARTLDGASAGAAFLRPADPARPVVVDERVVDVPEHLEQALRQTARRYGVTLNTILQAAWSLVLQRYCGGEHATFGVTSSCRPPELPHVDRMMGLFTNTLPVRVPVPGDAPLAEWLLDTQSRYTAVRRYEYSPLAQIKQWAGIPGPEPLFHSLVVFDNYATDVDLGDRLSVRLVDAVEKTSEPLVLIANQDPRFTVRVRYHRDRFEPGAAEEILACFSRALAAMTECDSVAAVAAATVADDPSAGGLGPRREYPDRDRTLVDLVDRQAAAAPDAPAIITEDETYSYEELAGAARRVATALASAGVRRGDVVGVCAERSPDLVAGVLGAQYAGAAYLPLDPSLPEARLAHLVRDAGAEVVFAEPETAATARKTGARRVLTRDDAVSGPDLPRPRPDDVAYLLYTSGSTGEPKGVAVSHRAVVNRLLWMQETFGLAPRDRVLQKTPFGFDVSVWELFWPLLTGAALVLARPGGHQDAEYLTRTIRRQRVTTAHFVPSMLRLFLDEPTVHDLPSLTLAVCSGEALAPDLVRRFRSLLPGAALHNLYGPTEAAIDVTWWDCARPAESGTVPIGDPVANTRAVVLDERLRPVPPGCPGELYLGGVQLAHGYHGRAALTAASFVAHPLAGPGGRLYRTGDRARQLPGGALEYLGRLDRQVKVNGYRIELGEIEQVLAGHPAVRESAVVVRERTDGAQLAAYFTAAAAEPDPGELRTHLRDRLPAYMVPATITALPSMPLNRNGKLDRTALPDPSRPGGGTAEAPATPGEAKIAAVFADVLEIPEADVAASFFDLGGNSYDAVRAIRRIDGATVGLLGAYPSARALAAALDGEASGILLPLRPPGPAAHTLVCVPFGGGSAITYQPLAAALSDGIALLSVSPPGHELGGDPGLRPLADVAEAATAAILDTVAGPLSVYGHCAGVALAVEIVRRLEAAGRPVERLFLGGAYPFYEPGRFGRWVQRRIAGMVNRGMLAVSARTVGTSATGTPAADQAEMRYLKSIGGFQGDLSEEELTFVMRAFRHDVSTAGRYFTEQWPAREPVPPLSAPITVLAGTADPLTPDPERRYRSWNRFSAEVELLTVDGGGHYFHQDRSDVVAAALEARCASVPRTDEAVS
ncbi:amino acid adenylation domain-containing protein [Amycolatopsis nivea]